MEDTVLNEDKCFAYKRKMNKIVAKEEEKNTNFHFTNVSSRNLNSFYVKKESTHTKNCPFLCLELSSF